MMLSSDVLPEPLEPFRNGEGEIVEQAGLVNRAALIYLDDIAQLKHDVSPSFDDRPRR